MPNFSSLAGLEVAMLIRLGELSYFNQVSPVSVSNVSSLAGLEVARLMRSG